MVKICAAVGCHNTDKNKDVKFFRFPKKNKLQRERWIEAINRINKDGTPWTPTENSRICSLHFLEEGRNKDPSIFSYNHRPTKRKKREEKEDRPAKKKPLIPLKVKEEEKEVEENFLVIGPDANVENKGCQTDILDVYHCTKAFFCDTINFNDKSTYVDYPSFSHQSTSTTHNVLVNNSTMTDKEPKKSFTDHLKSEDQFISTVGLSSKSFKNINDVISRELRDGTKFSTGDQLAIFLIKFKLSLSFNALSGIFHGDKKTISALFNKVLDVMIRKSGVIGDWMPKDLYKEILSYRNGPSNVKT